MPEKGPCTDLTCDNEIKELYECHCCLRLVCFYHLSKHIEIVKENKQRLDNLRNELNTVVCTLKLIIEREQNLVEQAKKIFDEPSSSIDELKNIIEKINQTIASNRSDVTEELRISKDDEYSTDINHDSIDAVSMDETTNSIEDQHVNEENKPKQKPYRRIFRKCPLTFNGAYGLTEANHSIEFCKHEQTRQFELYNHFIQKHRLKKVYAQRLVRAVVDGQDPKITKLFDENENVINHFYKVPCPICCGQINSSEYNGQNRVTVTCQPRFIILQQLKQHLRRNHKISNLLANKLVDDIKQNQTKNDSDSVLLVPSTSSK
ncbi:unnamed protein product [Rotaria sordida]|uniref:Uncharacterized protein n=1 Tax=Rotaria sordida TaxID=392033 RepID=A0A815JLV9_9BILA|nr:unnamed protein product [Rotaria sordida]